MKAQIFSLKSQKKVCHQIEALLRSNFYRDIEVERRVYDGKNETTAREIGRSYLELMRASTIRVGSFSVDAEYEEGSWGHYWDPKGEYFLRLRRDLRTKVFPSVAIMSRMVMVPNVVHQAFDVPADFAYLFRPLDLQGVDLTDFGDTDAIQRAVVRVAAQIRKEIVSIGRRHMSLQGTQSPDVEELARLLGVDEDFVEELRHEIVRPTPRLIPKVTSKPVRLNSVSQVMLEIRNESENALGAVRVQIRAPWRVMRAPLAQYLDFGPGKAMHQTIEFEVVPKTTPYCPLEVLFLLDDATHDIAPPVPLILDVISK